MKFTDTEVFGFKRAISGMRNPMNSWIESLPYAKELIMYEGE